MLPGQMRRAKVKNKARDLNNYAFMQGEKILVDANIWLYLFHPPVNPHKSVAQHYSKAFGRLVTAQARPLLDTLILSEYLNRYCRIEWEGRFKAQYGQFKGFRQSADFQQVASDAKFFATQILKLCHLHSVVPDTPMLDQALMDFSSGKIDFNDAFFVEICKT